MITEYKGYSPDIDRAAFIAETSDIIGRVRVERDASVWHHAVLRGDVDEIIIETGANIQDGTMVHTNYDMPVIVGAGTTVGHGAILHGCRIAPDCLIGMGAILLDGCTVGKSAVIAAGALVGEYCDIPGGAVYMGIPAKRVRDITSVDEELIRKRAAEYIGLAGDHRG